MELNVWVVFQLLDCLPSNTFIKWRNASHFTDRHILYGSPWKEDVRCSTRTLRNVLIEVELLNIMLNKNRKISIAFAFSPMLQTEIDKCKCQCFRVSGASLLSCQSALIVPTQHGLCLHSVWYLTVSVNLTLYSFNPHSLHTDKARSRYLTQYSANGPQLDKDTRNNIIDSTRFKGLQDDARTPPGCRSSQTD